MTVFPDGFLVLDYSTKSVTNAHIPSLLFFLYMLDTIRRYEIIISTSSVHDVTYITQMKKTSNSNAFQLDLTPHMNLARTKFIKKIRFGFDSPQRYV